MDIYIKNGSTKIQLPVIPESISVAGEGRFAEYDIMSLGEVNQHNGKNLLTYSFDSFFPPQDFKGKRPLRVWVAPEELDARMKSWMRSGTVLNLMITGTKINVDVVISEYSSEIKYKGFYYYTITFKEYQKITVSVVKPSGGSSSSSSGSSKTTSKTKKITVKKGQTLKKLAKKYLGSSSKYKVIYKANKKTIDARNKKEKKKHPKKKISKYKIYTGQVLIIPASSSSTISNSKVLSLKKALKADGYGKMKMTKTLDSATKTAMKKVKLRKGKKGSVVKFVQGILGVTKSGKYDAKTIAAVKKYQRKKKLTVNGVVGSATLTKMIS